MFYKSRLIIPTSILTVLIEIVNPKQTNRETNKQKNKQLHKQLTKNTYLLVEQLVRELLKEDKEWKLKMIVSTKGSPLCILKGDNPRTHNESILLIE